MTAIFFPILYACPNISPGREGSCPFGKPKLAILAGGGTELSGKSPRFYNPIRISCQQGFLIALFLFPPSFGRVIAFGPETLIRRVIRLGLLKLPKAGGSRKTWVSRYQYLVFSPG
jgi:hypothetical protein